MPTHHIEEDFQPFSILRFEDDVVFPGLYVFDHDDQKLPDVHLKNQCDLNMDCSCLNCMCIDCKCKSEILLEDEAKVSSTEGNRTLSEQNDHQEVLPIEVSF
jgi:hypothetical protein